MAAAHYQELSVLKNAEEAVKAGLVDQGYQLNALWNRLVGSAYGDYFQNKTQDRQPSQDKWIHALTDFRENAQQIPRIPMKSIETWYSAYKSYRDWIGVSKIGQDQLGLVWKSL